MRRWTVLFAAFVAVAILATGCGSASKTPAPTTSAVAANSDDTAFAALIPAKVKATGKLQIGINVLPLAPDEFGDGNGGVVGFDVDLMDAVAHVLGLTTQYTQSQVDLIIPAVAAGTFDIGASSLIDTKAREKLVDFTSYFSAGTSWAAAAGKPVDPNNACGLRVALQTGTTEDLEDVPAKSRVCTVAGKPAIIKVPFDNQNDAANAVMTGRADAMSADSPVTAYAVKQSGGKLIGSGATYNVAPYGWAVAKGSTLAQALQMALQTLIKNGLYLQILQKWGLQAGAITAPLINSATI